MSVGRREGVEWMVGTDGEPKAGSSIHLNRKVAIVCSVKSTKSHGLLVRPIQSLMACSWTPSVVLLKRPSGTVHSIVDCHEFYRVTEMMPMKVDLVIAF